MREFNIDLNPKFIYSKSRSTQELSNSKASNYLEFLALKSSNLFLNGKFVTIPCTKSDIFQSKDLDLIEKQKLLSFILGIMKYGSKDLDVNATTDFHKPNEVDFELSELIAKNKNEKIEKLFDFVKISKKLEFIIKYVLADLNPNAEDEEEYTIEELVERIYKYLSSIQVFDDSPFLYPTYGSSEFSQALCRVASVYNAIFIVNDSLEVHLFENVEYKINPEMSRYIVKIIDYCIWFFLLIRQ